MRCKSYERAKKKLTVLEAPNVLTIALKRFQSGKSGKLNKAVRFPEILDLAPYMSGTDVKSPMYSLYAVVVHQDITNAAFYGHYVCYVKSMLGKWYKTDDSKSFFLAMTKIMGTLGPKSRSVEVISSCLKAGMSVARFDFSLGDIEYHQETLENLKKALKSTKKLCAVMLDTVGPELQVVNKSEWAISLEAEAFVTLTPDQTQEASSQLLPINFTGLSKASKQYFEFIKR